MREHPVRRGGRDADKADQSVQKQKEQLEAERLQREADLRRLLPMPEFRRMLVHWITQSQMFANPIGLPHDMLREWTGKSFMGHQLWADAVAVDPTFATFILTSTPKTPTNG